MYAYVHVLTRIMYIRVVRVYESQRYLRNTSITTVSMSLYVHVLKRLRLDPN